MSQARERPELRWGVERRLEFIEFRLLWEGGINRADITDRFGVSVPQASKDLSLYQSLAPDNLTYDRSGKRYLAAPNFQPRFLKVDADRYLAQLRSVADGALDFEESWLSQPPPFEAAPMPQRHVDPQVLLGVIGAIRKGAALEIRYQSLSPKRPQAMWRRISPHAFAFDGNRWHVRAFCHLDRMFKDFLLPRILQVGEAGPAAAAPGEDAAWNEIVSVDLVPNRELTEEQRDVIAQDFGMRDGRLEVRVRLALVYYMLRRLNLQDFGEGGLGARDQPMVLAKPADVRAALHRESVRRAPFEDE